MNNETDREEIFETTKSDEDNLEENTAESESENKKEDDSENVKESESENMEEDDSENVKESESENADEAAEESSEKEEEYDDEGLPETLKKTLKKKNKIRRLKKPEKKSVKIFLAGAASMLAAFVIFFLLYMNIPFNYDASSPTGLAAYKKINEVARLIDRHYAGKIDDQLLTDYMILGLVSGLEDRYSTYFTEEQYDEVYMRQSGQYLGIGVNIIARAEDGDIEVTAVEEESPADEAGILAGDIILSINGTQVNSMSTSDVTQLIQNAESDEIALVIYRPDDEAEIELTVTRNLLESTIVWGGILEDDNIGYIAISSFTRVTASQFEEILEQVKEYGAESLIIDLRNNSGGLVSAACDTLRHIIPEGVLVYEEYKDGSRKELTSESGEEIDMPIVLLVNEETASSSEIFTGAIQDYGLATIMGTQTYGKGIIQDVYRLSDNSVVRLTVAQYYTPNGNYINEVGIIPDIVVEADETSETDVQLEAAIEYLSSD